MIGLYNNNKTDQHISEFSSKVTNLFTSNLRSLQTNGNECVSAVTILIGIVRFSMCSEVSRFQIYAVQHQLTLEVNYLCFV